MFLLKDVAIADGVLAKSSSKAFQLEDLHFDEFVIELLAVSERR